MSVYVCMCVCDVLCVFSWLVCVSVRFCLSVCVFVSV